MNDVCRFDLHEGRLPGAYPTAATEALKSGLLSVVFPAGGKIGLYSSWFLRESLLEGLRPGGQAGCSPPTALHEVLRQLAELLDKTAPEVAWAQCLKMADTFLAPYARLHDLTYGQVRKAMESFFCDLAADSRTNGKRPWRALTLDMAVNPMLEDHECVIGGAWWDIRQKECLAEQDMINRAILELLHDAGDSPPFLPVYNVREDFPWDGRNGRLLSSLAATHGTPLFQNFTNSETAPEIAFGGGGCRLWIGFFKPDRRHGGLFSGLPSGSIGMVTLHLDRLAREASGLDDFHEALVRSMNVAREILDVRRDLVEAERTQGPYPVTAALLQDGPGIQRYTSNIGIAGMADACERLLGTSLDRTPGGFFLCDVVRRLRKITGEFQGTGDVLYPLELSPHPLAAGPGRFANGSLLPRGGTAWEIQCHQQLLLPQLTGDAIMQIRESPDHPLVSHDDVESCVTSTFARSEIPLLCMQKQDGPPFG